MTNLDKQGPNAAYDKFASNLEGQDPQTVELYGDQVTGVVLSPNDLTVVPAEIFESDEALTVTKNSKDFHLVTDESIEQLIAQGIAVKEGSAVFLSVKQDKAKYPLKPGMVLLWNDADAAPYVFKAGKYGDNMENADAIKDAVDKQYAAAEGGEAKRKGFIRVDSTADPVKAIPLKQDVIMSDIWGGTGPGQFCPAGSLLQDLPGEELDRYGVEKGSLPDYSAVNSKGESVDLLTLNDIAEDVRDAVAKTTE